MNPNKLPDSLRVKWRSFEMNASGRLGVAAGFVLALAVLVLVPVVLRVTALW